VADFRRRVGAPGFFAAVALGGCAAAAPNAPITAPAAPCTLAGAPPALSASAPSPLAPNAPASASSPAALPAQAPAAPPAPSPTAPPAPSLPELEQRVRDAGFAPLAEIVAVRVAQARRKMKLSEDEARAVCEALLAELPNMPEARRMVALMPKASIELVRSVRERGVPRDEAERMATFLLDTRTALQMDNTAAFDENCSHVVGREWSDIDYRDEGMQWEKQRNIYVPKGVLHFKDVANLRQFFRVESQAPYFQKVYGVKGKAL